MNRKPADRPNTAGRSIRRVAVLGAAALVLTLLVAALSVTGCTLREPDDPTVDEPPTLNDAPSAVTPTAPPAPPEPEVVTAELGEEASAGAWRLVVREAEFAERVGDLSAAQEGALLLRVEIGLANLIDTTLRVSPVDFSVTDGEVSMFPLESAQPDLDPDREIDAGKAADFSAVFGIPESKADEPLTLVFEPTEGGPARVEVALE